MTGPQRDILAIVGSYRWPTEWLLDIAGGVMEQYVAANPPDQIISGGAPGVDTRAKQLANDLGIDFEEFLPRNQRWAPDGFEDRNLVIAQTCTRLLAIRYFVSRTFGSGWTALRARELGKNADIVVVNTDGTYTHLHPRVPLHGIDEGPNDEPTLF